MRTAGIRRDVAAKRRHFLTRRVRGVEESVARSCAREIEVDEAGFDFRAAIARVDFENAIHSRKRNDDAAVRRNRAAAQTGSRASRDDRLAALSCDADDLRDLTHIFRNDCRARQPVLAVRIKRVDGQIFGFGVDGVGPQCCNQPLGEHAHAAPYGGLRTESWKARTSMFRFGGEKKRTAGGSAESTASAARG